MKTVVGFSFTESPVQRLIEEGFLFKCSEKSLVHGYREFICPLSSQLGAGLSIEIREIIDETAYFNFKTKFQAKNNFSPFESENTEFFDEVQHPNSVYFVEGILGEEMEACELKDYLKIRKQYPIWALWLKCHDFELFNKLVNPDKYFLWKNQNATLLHLGQSCFDLLITAA